MGIFKHSLILNGEASRKDEFTKQLELLGYVNGGTYLSLKTLTVGNPIGENDFQTDKYLFQNNPFPREYNFNIDQQWQFETNS